MLAAVLIMLASFTVKADTVTTDTKKTNPIAAIDAADPGVVRTSDRWYVYHTGSYKGGHYPIEMSTRSLTSWTRVGYIFPRGNEPQWAAGQSFWAPEVHRVNDKYIAYFTTREKDTNRFVVGAAVADEPEGPFKDIGQPIVRNETVGLIDVNYFQDSNTGKKYILWKEDQNDFDPPRPTPIIIQELKADGMTVTGEPKELIRNDRPWEGVLVEAPTLIYHEGWYYLFYSGNIFAVDEYAVGVARSRDVWGPYEKFTEPIMAQDKDFSGPGHQFVIQDKEGRWHMFYHARMKAVENSSRYLMHDFIRFGDDGWPRVNDGHPSPLDPKKIEEAVENRRAYLERRQT